MFTQRRTSRLGRQRHLEEVDSGDTSAPPDRIAAAHSVHLGWWDVVNTETLDDIPQEHWREIQMIYVNLILVIIIIILVMIQWKQKKLIESLQKEVHKIEKTTDDSNEIFWMRFPFYSCLVFFFILILLIFISIPGWYKFSTLQLFFLTLSSVFFVCSDLCLVGMNMNTKGLAPTWVEALYKKTSKSAYKRFFWLAFIFFIVSFILQPYEPKSLKVLMEIYNKSFGLLALSFVVFIYGIRSLGEISQNKFNKK